MNDRTTQPRSPRDALYVVPSLKARIGEQGGLVLTQKFVEGVEEYVRRWPGPVVVCMHPSEDIGTNLDEVEIDPATLSFEFRWLPRSTAEGLKLIAPARLVLTSLVDRLTEYARACRSMNIPIVYIAEYTYETRRRIIDAETESTVRRWRRHAYNRRTERRYRGSVRLADGVQCNGTPTFEAYSELSPRPLLYFDTRVRAEMLADAEAVRRRTDALLAGEPLRLAFSGRLISMKGADHLPRVATELRRLGVPFRMDICGGGPLQPAIESEIAREHLEDVVKLRGVLRFREELIPYVANSVDLFVCCHTQGDPSCTYLETMSCGTPIVGYDNEAFRGVVATSGVGWPSPLDDPIRLARRIAELERDRATLADAAHRSLAFAAQHTFEETMSARVAHMRACCEAAEAGIAG